MKKDKIKKVSRWALMEIELTNQNEIQAALDQGYEPFATMTRFMQASVLDPKAANGVIPVNVMYFKMKYDLSVDEQIKDKVVDLVKKKLEQVQPIIEKDPA